MYCSSRCAPGSGWSGGIGSVVGRSSEPAWIGIDIGTQSVRALAADESGRLLATAARPLLSSRRAEREHVQDPEEWWPAVCDCCREITGNVRREDLKGLAIDATSGTILLTDDHLRPASEALLYDDGRAEAEARAVNEAVDTVWADRPYRFQTSWALPKLLWLWRRREGGKTLYLTHQNDFIQNRLAGRRLATDWSHSLKSGYDLGRSEWPRQVFEKVGLPTAILPDVVAPGALLGHVSAGAAEQTGLPPRLPILAGMTDGCAAQIAAGGVRMGSWNSVLGTTLVVKGVTERRLDDPLGVVYSHRAPEGQWLPGGASSTGAGSIAKHFQKEDLKRLEWEAAQRGPSKTVVYPLGGTGERFPFTAAQAVGFEIDRPRDDADFFRAILQGVAFVERLAFDYLQQLGASLSGEFSITGGAVQSALWNQVRADVLGRRLTIPAVTEPAFGMAILAASHRSSLSETATRMIASGSAVTPVLPFAETYGEQYRRWLRALQERGWLPAELAAYSSKRIGP